MPAVTVGFKIHFCNPPSPTVALSVVPSVVQTASGPLEWFFGKPVSATYNTVGLAKKKFCGLKLTLSPALRLLPLLLLPAPAVLRVYLPVPPVLPRPGIKAGPYGPYPVPQPAPTPVQLNTEVAGGSPSVPI